MKPLLALLLLAGLGPAALAQQAAPTGSLIPADDQAETIGYAVDAARRMTVDVNVDGQGPFQFVVDTGAERTVISRELAATLQLVSGGDVILASVAAVTRVPSVMIGELEVGRRTLNDIQAPALAQRNLGAQGMLGVDTLRSQRVVFDFLRRELTLSASHIADDNWSDDTIVVTGRTRLGRLILSDASVDGQRITVIVDTGSQITVGNSALRRELVRRGRLGEVRPLQLLGVTGDLVGADYTIARRLRLGDVRFHDMPIAFADVELFNHLGLRDRPAILLGMDALRMFDRVSIDFANRRVRLLRPHSRLEGGETQVASR